MCNDDKLFVEIQCLKQSQEVTLGDGHVLEMTGVGVVELQATLGDEKTKRCILCNVLYVPQLSYNLPIQCIASYRDGKKVLTRPAVESMMPIKS